MKTKYLHRPDGKIAYDDSETEGELVIMLPGVGALRSEYRYLAPLLQQAGYRVVTADLRGHGESDANFSDYSLQAVGQDILALIDHLDAGPAHVIGTSFSPGAAVYAAAEQPQVIRSLVLIGPFVRDPQTSSFQKLLTALMLAGPWKVSAWGAYYKTLYPSGQPADYDQYIDQLKDTLRQPGKFDAFKTMAMASKIESEKRLGQVHAPVLVVMGTQDPDWPDPAAEAAWIADRLDAETILIEGAGHYPQTEMPEQTNPRIVGFLQRVSAGAEV
jgi:pimeloyl-ACP methyl ester carboxylesterase